MALIKCPECGSEISDKSEVCIKCGCPLGKSVVEDDCSDEGSMVKPTIIIVSILVVLVTTCVVLYFIINDDTDDTVPVTSNTNVVIVSPTDPPTEKPTDPPTELKLVTVPDVVNLKKDDAIDLLEQYGLDYKIVEVGTLNKNYYDAILAQYPLADLEVEEKTVVNLGVAVDKQPISLNLENFNLNYVGGLDLTANFTNNTDKGIKYIYMYIETYNSVGDPAPCKIKGENLAKAIPYNDKNNKPKEKRRELPCVLPIFMFERYHN